MCLVEIAGAPKPVAACAAQISDGMKIVTQSEVTRNARGGVMEFLLANHPLDCPICDQGGECDLQDISVVYGYKKGRFKEYKRAVEDKNLGPLIATVMNRCIHCTRCIRFSEEIMGVFDLGTIGRGRSTEIGTYIEKFVSNELSGNLIDLCPVGALTNGPYAYTSRPWELTSVDTIDLMDGLGSNIQVDARGAEIMRVLPRIHEEINEEWISDKSRFSYDGLKKQRLTVPLKRNKDGTFEELTWQEALETVAKKMNDVQGSEMSAIIGNFADVESIIALKDMLNRLDCDNFEIRSDAPKLNADLRSSYIMNSRISGIEDSDLILLVGVNPKTENPVLNARILKAVKRGAKVAIIGTSADMGYEYIHLGNTTRSLIDIAEGKHPFAARLNTAKLPMVILGSRALERKDGEGILAAVKTIANNSNVLNEKEGWNGFNILHHEGSRCGALDVGISSNTDPNFKPKFVYILGADNIRTEDIPEDAFVVYQGTHGDAELARKDINLTVSRMIGAIAKPDKIQFVKGLPKTRSGKIMRRILRKIAEGETENLGDITTLLDPGVVEEIKNGKL